MTADKGTNRDKDGVDGLQGLVLLVGISFGLVPLVRVLLGGEVGRLLAWAPGTEDAPGSWLVPVAVVLVCVTVIGLLERTKTS